MNGQSRIQNSNPGFVVNMLCNLGQVFLRMAFTDSVFISSQSECWTGMVLKGLCQFSKHKEPPVCQTSCQDLEYAAEWADLESALRELTFQ